MCGGKIGGDMLDLHGVKKQAKAAEANAERQAAAVREATANQQQALMQAAQAAADQQAQQAARLAAEDKAAAAVSAPLETAEVQLDAPSTESATAGRAKRRAAFGKGSSGGVTI